MHVLIPINFTYLQRKYGMHSDLLDFIREQVLAELVARIAREEKVESIEVVSDFGFSTNFFSSDKATITRHEVDPNLDANGVVSELIKVRQVSSEHVVQYNPLFPFVSVDSMWQAYTSVSVGKAQSAIGSFLDRRQEAEVWLAKEHDLGILNGYSVGKFRESHSRICPPIRLIGLSALELIGLRNSKDLALFNLVLNSGIEV